MTPHFETTTPLPDANATFTHATGEVPAVELDWKEALGSLSTVEPGTVLTGFESEREVDALVLATGNFLMRGGKDDDFKTTPPPLRLANTSGQLVYDAPLTANTMQPPSQAIRPRGKNFLGTFQNLRVVMASDTASPKTELPEKNLVLLGEMHVAGKGRAGAFAKLCKVSTRAVLFGGKNHPNSIKVSYADLPGSTPEEIADGIIDESSQIAREVIRRGLAHVMLGGAVELGKRR